MRSSYSVAYLVVLIVRMNPLLRATCKRLSVSSTNLGREVELGKVLFGTMLGCFGIQVEGLGVQKEPSQAPNPVAQAGRIGRSLFNRVWMGLGWLRGTW